MEGLSTRRETGLDPGDPGCHFKVTIRLGLEEGSSPREGQSRSDRGQA